MHDQPIPLGLCQCGCGEETRVAARNDPRIGAVKGRPRRFRKGHSGRSRGVPACGYVVEDRGYFTPCFVWKLGLDSSGYSNTRGTKGHIVAYEAAHGPVPEGLQVDHLCRVRACVNPGHLEAVTQTVNVRRGARTRLTPDLVRMIRASSLTQLELARRLGVTQAAVSSVVRRRTWRDID